MSASANGDRGTWSRLEKFLARHPNAQRQISLSDIARELQISCQRVSLMLPEWYGVQKDARDERLQRFAQRHPDARREGSDGYMYWREIGTKLRMSDSGARKLWRRVALPEEAPDESPAEREARTQRERLSRVLRTERCIVCKQPFPWTVFRERERRLHGKRFVCSRSCAQTLRFHPEIARRSRREHARWGS